MICPRCSVAEVSPLTGRCVLCGYEPAGGVSVRQAVADEVLETVQRELAGQFQLQLLLRRDRRSNLYVARDLETDRLVALRLIPRPGPVDDELLRRFEQAAAVAAQLRHPHLIPVLAHGVTTSLLWYSMDSVKGRTLTAVLERGPQSRSACEQLLEQVASALEYLHRNGVVHGGLNPVTVLVDGDGWARVTDPGIIAAVFRAAAPRSDWEALLDPVYAAPEVLERRLAGPAADQYSLALLAYQYLTGRPAGTGETVDDVRRERAAGLEPLGVARPDLPPYVATAVARALRETPAERFGSVLDFVAVLSGAAMRPLGGGLSPSAAPGGPPLLVIPDHERRPSRRRRLLVYLGLAVLAGAGTWGVLQYRRPAPDRWVHAPQPAAPRPGIPATPVPDSVSGAAGGPAFDPVVGAAEPRPGPVEAPAPLPNPPRRPVAAVPEAPATLFVNASPWGTVYLDGRPVGNTPRPNLEIGAGVHVLRVVRDGYAPFEREIRLTPGQVLRITDIVLEPIRP
jgi:serine/threonine-protein kinase